MDSANYKKSHATLTCHGTTQWAILFLQMLKGRGPGGLQKFAVAGGWHDIEIRQLRPSVGFIDAVGQVVK